MIDALAALADLLRAPPPWLIPYLRAAELVSRSESAGSIASALNAACEASDATAIRFVEHDATAAEAYESIVARTGRVPTRNNFHDLFNGLVWLTYPHTKRRLNELHAQAILDRGISGSRGALRDALTLFDENAAVMSAPELLVDALQRRDWRALFVSHRTLWRNARVELFGHALLEKLLRPRKNITAHVWIVNDSSDESIAASLEVERLATKSFLPMPVLGIPGWCTENERPQFYDDADVFRPMTKK